MNAELRSHRSSRDVWVDLRRRSVRRRVVGGAIGAGLLGFGLMSGRLAGIVGVTGSVLLGRALAGADDLGRLVGLVERLRAAQSGARHGGGALDDAIDATFPASDPYAARIAM